MTTTEVTITSFRGQGAFHNYRREDVELHLTCIGCQLKELTPDRIVFYSDKGLSPAVSGYTDGKGTVSTKRVK